MAVIVEEKFERIADFLFRSFRAHRALDQDRGAIADKGENLFVRQRSAAAARAWR